MRRPPLRRLVFRGRIEPDRIFHHNVWYRGHTNRRYEELLPRLERVDAYLMFLPEQRLARGVAVDVGQERRPGLTAFAARDEHAVRTDTVVDHVVVVDHPQRIGPGHPRVGEPDHIVVVAHVARVRQE